MKSHEHSDSSNSTEQENQDVSAGELLAAIDAELDALKQQSAVIVEEQENIRHTFNIDNLPSNMEKLHAYALNAAIVTLGGNDLSEARKNFHNAGVKLEKLSRSITSHNDKLARQGVIRGLVNLLADTRKASSLAQARQQGMQDYQAARQQLQDIAHRIQSPQQVEKAVSIAQRKVNKTLSARRKLRDLEIRLRRIEDDAAVRQKFRALLTRIPSKARLSMRHRQLDKALHDPLLKTRLTQLAQRYE